MLKGGSTGLNGRAARFMATHLLVGRVSRPVLRQFQDPNPLIPIHPLHLCSSVFPYPDYLLQLPNPNVPELHWIAVILQRDRQLVGVLRVLRRFVPSGGTF